MSKEKKTSNTNLGSGSYYSEIIARAISLKSSNASVKSSNASAESISASTLSGQRQQQGSRGQDAGSNTVEKLYGIREEAAISSRVTRQLDEVPDDVSGQQRKQQGSGESATEKISPNKEDDLSLSSMSSVVSRANDSISNSAQFGRANRQKKHLAELVKAVLNVIMEKDIHVDVKSRRVAMQLMCAMKQK